MLPRKETVMRTRGQRRVLTRKHRDRRQEVRKVQELREKKDERDIPMPKHDDDWIVFTNASEVWYEM